MAPRKRPNPFESDGDDSDEAGAASSGSESSSVSTVPWPPKEDSTKPSTEETQTNKQQLFQKLADL